jgi:predicted SAM-dependent methyltransferase
MTETYDRGYFESDDQTRGYRGEGYRDFACHFATAHEILALKPSSAIEIGAGRGYVSKILKNNGVEVLAVDISRHCYHTRAVDNFALLDATKTPWEVKKRDTKYAWEVYPSPIKDREFDLCFSVGLLEEIPDDKIDAVIKESARVSTRGFHAIECKTPDDINRMQEKFKAIAPDYPVTIVDKNDVEYHGDMAKILPVIPQETREAGTGRVHKKINFGCFVGQFYYGWINSDILDLDKFAATQGYTFLHLDASKPMPFPDGYADAIFSSHLIEHLSREEGARFVQECFRVLRPGGVIRLATPDVGGLMSQYHYDMGKYEDHLADYKDAPDEDPDGLKQYRHVNVGVGNAETPLDAFAHIALSGHKAVYDLGVLYKILADAGFEDDMLIDSPFVSLSSIMAAETIVSHPTLSMTIDAVKPTGKKGGKKK